MTVVVPILVESFPFPVQYIIPIFPTLLFPFPPIPIASNNYLEQ